MADYRYREHSRAFILLVMVALAGMFYFGRSWGTTNGPKVEVTSSPTVNQLQSLGELVVVRASVADVLEAKVEGYQGSWLVKGDGLVSLDLRKAKFASSDLERKRLVVKLPSPRIVQPRVDHEKTKTWQIKKLTWVPSWVPFGWPGDPDVIRDQAMREAQRLVEHACKREDIIQLGRSNAELLLTHMYRFIGWEIEIEWQP